MGSLSRYVAANNDDCNAYHDASVDWACAPGASYPFIGCQQSTMVKVGFGFRFLNITIPRGSIINSASLTLTSAYGISTIVMRTYITGDLELSAAGWTTDTWYNSAGVKDYRDRRGTVVLAANNNKRTVHQVAWDGIGAWTKDSQYTSPDISAIIQEIVSQSGWVSGNNMALWWDDHDGRGTQTYGVDREIYAYINSHTKCALLTITYTPVATARGDIHIDQLIFKHTDRLGG